jgi:hypothetical protein
VDGDTRAPPLRKKALFDLEAIQSSIRSGELDEYAVEIKTRKCELDLQRLQWSYRDLLQFMLALRPYALAGDNDFKSAQWCKSSAGRWYPCDAYAAEYDPIAKRLSPGAASIYLKFSIPEDGECLLITVSAHD